MSIRPRNIPLVASGARVASGNSGLLPDSTNIISDLSGRQMLLLLDVTAAGTLVGDLLNVYVQKNVGPPGAPVWHDMVSFTQVLGNGGAKQFVATLSAEALAESDFLAVSDAALAAGTTNQGPWGNLLRVKWVIVNGGGTHSFTFSVNAIITD